MKEQQYKKFFLQWNFTKTYLFARKPIIFWNLKFSCFKFFAQAIVKVLFRTTNTSTCNFAKFIYISLKLGNLNEYLITSLYQKRVNAETDWHLPRMKITYLTHSEVGSCFTYYWKLNLIDDSHLYKTISQLLTLPFQFSICFLVGPSNFQLRCFWS